MIDFLILKSSIYFDIYYYQTHEIKYYRIKISNFIDELLNYRAVSGLKHTILIFLISWPLAKFLNLFFSREFSFDYTIERWGNQLERMIWFSLTNIKDEDKLLMVTTKSNKVYIGYINKLSEPIGESHITILPNFSGYRNKDNLKVEITTRYTDVIEKYIIENREDEIGDKLGIILPVSEILIVSRFDNEIFGKFNTEINSKLTFIEKLKALFNKS